MPPAIPDIPEAERTPLVLCLLDLIHQQQEEIALLKGLKPRPQIAPSILETPPPPPRPPDQKRPGKDQRSKTEPLTSHREEVIPCPDGPEGATFRGYEDYVVQELILQPRPTRYRRERWQTPDGQTLRASLPDDVFPGRHLGPTLHSHILHQYHHQRVTQPLEVDPKNRTTD